MNAPLANFELRGVTSPSTGSVEGPHAPPLFWVREGSLLGTLVRAIQQLMAFCKARGVAVSRAKRRLRITETVSLGEKRAVSLLVVDGREFLIGSANGSVSLLTALPPREERGFGEVLQESASREGAG